MARSMQALINPAMLGWARALMGLDLDYVAEKAKIAPDRLVQWETGGSSPTVAQLRKLARIYRFPIAVFYLPAPPDHKIPHPSDRRFLPGFEEEGPSPELSFEFRWADERREIALELLTNIGVTPKRFDAEASIRNTPEKLAMTIRGMLGITYDDQTTWRDSRLAFNRWREKLERLDVLVFQATEVPLQAMRGYSMFFDILPIIGVNRRDTYNARSFTLLHEMTHLMLRIESLCDMHEEGGELSEPDKQIEVFCNSVAGCTLVPKSYFQREEAIGPATQPGEDGDKAIRDLARKYSVSRELIVRRMLTLGLVGESFYRSKREQYHREYAILPPPSGGFVHPAVDAVSSSGRSFVGLTLENLNRGFITTSDFSDFLRVKIKHLGRLQDSFLVA